jgi:hypothetical protein
MPDGSQTRYSIVESPIMEAALAEKNTEIKSYLVYGIDDPGAFGRVDMSPKGFRGIIYTSRGRIFIDPDWQNPTIQRYLLHKSSGDADSSGFQCNANQSGSNRAYTPVHSFGT